MERFVFAGRDVREIADLRAALATLNIGLLTLDDFPGAPEPVCHGQFSRTAWENANALSDFTGLPCLAAVSGFRIKGGEWRLDGEAGNTGFGERIDLVLEKLSGKTGDERRAEYVSYLVLKRPGEEPKWMDGFVMGRVTKTPGGTGGTGFDSIFAPFELGTTLAEADDAARERLRSWPLAIRNMLSVLSYEWEPGENRELEINRQIDFSDSKALLLGIVETRDNNFFWMVMEPKPHDSPTGDRTLRNTIKVEREAATAGVRYGEPSYFLRRMAIRGDGIDLVVTGGNGSSGSLRGSVLGSQEGIVDHVLERAGRYSTFSRFDPRFLYAGKMTFNEKIRLEPLLAARTLHYTMEFRGKIFNPYIEKPFTIPLDGGAAAGAAVAFSDPETDDSCRLVIRDAFVVDGALKSGRAEILSLLGPDISEYRRGLIRDELLRLRTPWNRLLFLEYESCPDSGLALYSETYLNQPFKDMAVEYSNRILGKRDSRPRIFCAGYVKEDETDECAVEVFAKWPLRWGSRYETVDLIVP